MSDNVFRVPSPGEIDEQGDVMMRLADELRDTVLPFVVRIRELLEEARAADTECVGRLKVLRDNASQAEAQYAYYEENVRRSKELLEKYRDTKEKIQRLIDADVRKKQELMKKRPSTEAEQQEIIAQAAACEERIAEYRSQYTALSMEENRENVNLQLLLKEEHKARAWRKYYVGKYQNLLKAYALFTEAFKPVSEAEQQGRFDTLFTRSEGAAEELNGLRIKLDALSQELQSYHWGV